MKGRLEKIVEGTKQFVKSKVGMGILAVGLACSYVGCGDEDEEAYKCSCPATNEQRGASGPICASTKEEAEEKFGEEYGCKGVSCSRFPANDYFCGSA